MSATLYSTGPVYIYVSTGKNGIQPAFLGMGERAPTIEVFREFDPVYTDAAAKVPHDYAYGGEYVTVSATMTYYNEDVLRNLQNVPGNANIVRGQDGRLDRGSLMMTEGFSRTLWLKFGFGEKLAYTVNGMPKGYRFFNAILFGPDVRTPGTQANKISVNFRCSGSFIPTGNANSPMFKVYDHDTSSVDSISPV